MALVALATIQLASPSSAEAADGRSDVATTTFTVNPAAGRIDVAIDVTVHNSTANTVEYVSCTEWYYDYYLGYYPVYTTCPQTTRYYISNTYLWLERGANGFKVTADHGSAKVSLDKRGDSFDGYKVSFAKIFNGQTRRLHITYRIPSGAPRSASTLRVGKAFLSFCATANGVDSGRTRVVVPSTFNLEVDAHNGSFTTSTSGGTTTYDTGALSNPLDFWACLTGDDKAAYTSSTFTSPSGRQIVLHAWPEDPAWNASVQQQISTSLGALETLVGRGFPGTGPITVKEVTAGGLGDYVGTFDPQAGVAQVSEDYSQPGVVAHELSHSWFNGSLFDARWLSEGSAGWAESTITGIPCADPGAAPGTGRANLAAWTFAGPKATADEVAAVGYEYRAACYVISTIADRIGSARMREVLAALLDHKTAYRSGATALAGHSGAEDWRDWLDAVDELGLVPAGSSDLNYAQNLLEQFGAAPDTTSLQARSKARASYHELVGSVGDWVIPVAILRPMGAWQFAEATKAMASGSDAHAAAAKTDGMLPDVDALDGPVKDLFESATTLDELQQAAQRAADQERAAEAVARAKASLAAPQDVLVQVGLLGTDLGPTLSAGVEAVRQADLATAQDKADQVRATLADAGGQGMIRLAIAVVLLFAMGLILVLTVRRRSGRRTLAAASAVTDAMTAQPSLGPSSTGPAVEAVDVGTLEESP
jgi:hypothetical protein